MASGQEQSNARPNTQKQASAQDYAALLAQFRADADEKLKRFQEALEAAINAVKASKTSGPADHPKFQSSANSGGGIQGPPD
jgi:hypothetical protein